jgi:predicted dehydrogenase
MLRIAFVGAGGVNFGSLEGPWDHASRIEKLSSHGYQIQIVAIADIDEERARQVLERRKGSKKYGHLYRETKIRSSFEDMIQLDKPTLVFIGLPPDVHGLSQYPFNIENICVDAGVHMFIEKPISSAPPEKLSETMNKIKVASEEKGLIVSVGYMFRYSKAIEKMKEILKSEFENRPITMIRAKINCAYSEIRKVSWWDIRRSGGPIVEQSTHLVDLARYIVQSEAIPSTVQALSINATEPVLGELSDLPAPYGLTEDSNQTVEDQIPPEFRVPRVTTAIWKFESGALCNLTHGVMLHGSNIEAEFEVWADGLRMTLEDPYTTCKLTVRKGRSNLGPHIGNIQVFEFGNYESQDLSADPYYNEIQCFFEAILSKNASLIKSPYEDAFKTYELTWAIRRASEHSSNSTNY